MNNKLFDLNIKKILKNWNISDSIRELIVNAVDESILTNTLLPKIYKVNKLLTNKWIIEDYGRGLNYSHFSQNENKEKINSSKDMIDKFRIGFKDTAVVLHRNKIDFKIHVNDTIMYPVLSNKQGFDIKTIHKWKYFIWKSIWLNFRKRR